MNVVVHGKPSVALFDVLDDRGGGRQPPHRTPVSSDTKRGHEARSSSNALASRRSSVRTLSEPAVDRSKKITRLRRLP